MSGHSKWATTKRQKAAVDAKRGAVFTKLANIITIAAKEKGGDPSVNFSLRMAVDKAKSFNMPKENIERAIKRGTGEMQGEQIVELIYEGIGPANSQYIIKCLTDNKNRTAAVVRQIFTKYGGSLGAVMWNFDRTGIIRINQELIEKLGDEFELEIIEAGAQDIQKQEEGMIIVTKVEDLQAIKKFLENKEIATESAEIEFIAKETLKISDEAKEKIEKFEEELDNCEDVSDFYSNINNSM
jgi:YebC/PmpR family DNA-binding regulatory protein